MSGTVRDVGPRAGRALDAAELAAIVALWAVVRVRPGLWSDFLDDCRRDDVDVYLPLRPVSTRRHVGRRTMVFEGDAPMYPGYAFVPVFALGPVVERARGWGGVAGEGGVPWLVSGAEIARVREAEGALARAPWCEGRAAPAFGPGDRVRIVVGLLAGAEATVAPAAHQGSVTVTTDGGRTIHLPAGQLAAVETVEA